MALITGTSFSVTAPMRLMPPMRTTPTIIIRMMAKTMLIMFLLSAAAGTKAWIAVLMESVMLPTCTALPIPKEARPPKIQKMTPSHFQFLPRPFLI